MTGAPTGQVLLSPGVPAGAGEAWTASLVTEVGTPEDGGRDLQPTDVTPGVLGFAVTFGVAVVVVVIALALTGSLRKVNRGPSGPPGQDGRPDATGRGPGSGPGSGPGPVDGSPADGR